MSFDWLTEGKFSVIHNSACLMLLLPLESEYVAKYFVV